MVEGAILLVILLAAIAWIIIATAKIRLHAFLVLLLGAYFIGLAAGLPIPDIVKTIASGFGGTLQYIGIVIACGTIIGTVLEYSGGAMTMANTVLRLVGRKKSPLAMSLIGSVVSIPVFCDSGFVILSELNRSLAEKTKTSLSVMAIALSTGLYATHCFVPPTPGPIAAAGLLGADLGLVIMFGLIVSVPAIAAGYFWATRYAPRFKIEPKPKVTYEQLIERYGKLPSASRAFAPILVPIGLICLKSIADFPSHPFGIGTAAEILSFIGNPITALIIGTFISFLMVSKITKEVYHDWVGEGLKKAAVIILITGAGGALGAMLKATGIGTYLGSTLAQYNLGIFLPFLIAAALKTSQGSSTVALITTPALISPMLPAMGLTTPIGLTLTVLAIGAGSMVVSHANDSYFWVVSQFSDMDVSTAYRCQTLGTLVEGTAGMAMVAILALILL